MKLLKYFILLIINACRILFVYKVFPFILESNNVFVHCTYRHSQPISELELHQLIVARYLEKRKDWYTSNLGRILYNNADPRMFKGLHKKESFLVVVRPYEEDEITRFWDHPNDGRLKNCTVNNCKFTHTEDDIEVADAVVFNVHAGYEHVPNRTENSEQIWILFSEESPVHTFSGTTHKQPRNISHLAGRFNWMMTYRSDSEIPVPYGRTVPLPGPVKVDMSDVQGALKKLVPFWDKKQFQVLATIIISNCYVKHRMRFLNDILKYMDVEIDGACFGEKGTRCFHHLSPEVRPDCDFNKEYIFYLAFENSSCRQYITEKIFHNSYFKGAIPVLMGSPLEDCKKLLPPNSFLHVDNYKTPEDLTRHMKEISRNFESLLSFHVWRKHFSVTNEHGYFDTPSTHYCRVCEALNYNDGETKVYDNDDLRLFFDETVLCNMTYNTVGRISRKKGRHSG